MSQRIGRRYWWFEYENYKTTGIHPLTEDDLKVAIWILHYTPYICLFVSHPSHACSVLTIPLTADDLEIELVSGIYFPEIHVMKYWICHPTASWDCTSSFPLWGVNEFIQAPSLCARSLKIVQCIWCVQQTHWSPQSAASSLCCMLPKQAVLSFLCTWWATGTQATEPRHSAELQLLPLTVMFTSTCIKSYFFTCIIIWGCKISLYKWGSRLRALFVKSHTNLEANPGPVFTFHKCDGKPEASSAHTQRMDYYSEVRHLVSST